MHCWFSWSSWVAHVQLVTGRCIAAEQTKSWIIALWLVPGRKVYSTSQLMIYKKYSWPLALFWHAEIGEETRRIKVAILQQRGMPLQLFSKSFPIFLLSWIDHTAFYPRADFYQFMIAQFNSIKCAAYEWIRIGLLFLTYCLQQIPLASDFMYKGKSPTVW